MRIRKAVIPAAGLGTRFLPATKAVPKEMVPIIDKPAIQYIVEEAAASGIESILIVIGKGKQAVMNHFDADDALVKRLKKAGKRELALSVEQVSGAAAIQYIRQPEPLGLGHAILTARSFADGEPFAVLLGDTLFDAAQPALRQLIACAERFGPSVVGVQSVPRTSVGRFGVIDGVPVSDGIYRVSRLVEKPAPEEAPSELALLGRYILTPEIFGVLERQKPGYGGEIQLTDALAELAASGVLHACEVRGSWLDVGDPAGFLRANLLLLAKRKELMSVLKDDLPVWLNKPE